MMSLVRPAAMRRATRGSVGGIASGDDGSIEGRVGVSVAASIEAVPTGGHPRRGRDGQAPQLAKAASERIRSGLSPTRSAAVWAPNRSPRKGR